MFVCNCFGITEAQVRQHAADGADSPRRIASACKAGTDCGSCVRRIQAMLGRGACPRDTASGAAPAALAAPLDREHSTVLTADQPSVALTALAAPLDEAA